MMWIRVFLAISFVFLFSYNSGADTIYLKGGRKIEGRIFKQTADEVRMMVDGSPAIYFKDQIEKIEKEEGLLKKPQTSGDIAAGKKELIARFLEANGTRESIGRLFSQILTQVPEADRAQYQSILNLDKVISRLTPIYDRYYSEEELKELINFYKTPTGQKNLQITPKVVVEAMEETAKYFEEMVGSMVPAEEKPLGTTPSSASGSKL